MVERMIEVRSSKRKDERYSDFFTGKECRRG